MAIDQVGRTFIILVLVVVVTAVKVMPSLEQMPS